MDNIKIVLQDYLPVIASYAISIISYILFFVIRYSTENRGKALHSLVKEKVVYVDNENGSIRKENEALRKDIDILQRKMKRMDRAIKRLLEVKNEN